MPTPELVDIACEVRHQTDKAILIFDGVKEVWLPKSMAEVQDAKLVTMPVWLAKDKGLI